MTVEFVITSRKGENYKCLLDDIDADLLTLKWHILGDDKYIVRSERKPIRQQILMHRTILGRILGRELSIHEKVDHEDRNGLNNTRDNLRLATHGQNMANTKVRADSKIGIKGVYCRGNRCYARIKVNGKEKHLGAFDSIEQAHAAYIEAAKQIRGEFARGG
jgi:hypothetical protein